MPQVERHAANAVLPLLTQNGLTQRTDAKQCAIALKDLSETTPLWGDMSAEMQRTFPDYMPEFRTLVAMTPHADKPRLAFLTGHEAAAIAFLDLEVQG